MPRPGSPPTRSSTLMTSAPRSPSITEQTGPCCQIVQSITRMPSSGMVMAARGARAVRGSQARPDRLGLRGPRARGARMRVLVTGGTGLVGKPTCDVLRAAGHAVTVVSREPGRVPARAIGWDGLRAAMPETDAIVNLAGDPIAGGRWTAARKAEIRRSRMEATRALVEAIAGAEPGPQVLVSGAAGGYY